MSARRNKPGKSAAKKAESKHPKASEPTETETDADADADADAETDSESESESEAEPEPVKKPAPATAKAKPKPATRTIPMGEPRSLTEVTGALRTLSERLWFRVALGVVLACIHLFLFRQAAHSRLDLPFDTDPDATLEFSDLHAPATRGQPRQPHHWSRLIVSRFDAQHYEGTASRGLSACPTDPATATGGEYLDCGLGWLPGYGWAGGAVSAVTGMQVDYSLVFLSVVCAILLNVLWVSKTMVDRLGRFEAYAVLLAFNFYPDAFYLVTPLTEAAVLVLALGGFIAICNERWILASVLVGACTALRMPTVAFAMALDCVLLYVAWQRYKDKAPQWWKPLIGIPLSGWGQWLTMLVLQLKLGNWLAFFSARKAFGDENRMGRLVDVQYWLQGLTAQNMDMVIFIALLAIIALTWRRVVAKFTRTENIFLVVSSAVTIFLVPISPLHWWGITRYMMLCPLAFLGMGTMARYHRSLFVLWFVLCCAFYWHVELCQYITQGDQHICPCSGRTELRLPFAS
jgi:hypothetical protein